MKSEVKKIDASKMEITVAVEGDVVKNKFEDVFKKIGQQAKVKGFRPGHTPKDIIEKEFSSLAHERVLEELIPQLYGQAIEKEALHVLDEPQITDVKIDRLSLSFKAIVEITPKIEIKDYKGIAIDYKKIAVGADEVKRSIDSLKESRKAQGIDDAFAQVMGYPTVAELETAVQRQISVQKDTSRRREIEQQIIDAVTKDLDFKLPQSLVAKHLEEQLRQAKVELALRGVAKERIAQEEENLRKELEPQARQQVKVYLVLAEIASREKIPINDQMSRAVMEFLLQHAHWKISEA